MTVAKDSKGELENNSRKSRGLTKKRHSDSLKKGNTLTQGKMKKEDDVADNKYDAVRTSVSQDRVTVTLCTEELFPRTRYM